VEKEACCGIPSSSSASRGVKRLKAVNVPRLVVRARRLRDSYPVPSCTLMFKSELPLLFPMMPVKEVSEAMFDPFEYFLLRKA